VWFGFVMSGAEVGAQARATGPREVVAAVFAAQERGDVQTLVGLIDPEAMSEFKERQLQHDSVLGELSAKHSPADHRSLLQAVFRVRDRAEFQRLSPEEVITRWFALTMKQQTRIFLQFPSTARRGREILARLPRMNAPLRIRRNDRPSAVGVAA
jgi:hypothetical protein